MNRWLGWGAGILIPETVGPYLTWNSAGMARAKELGVPVLMTEYNSVACGGSPISEMVRLLPSPGDRDTYSPGTVRDVTLGC